MTLSLPIARRATKCLVPGASAIYLFNEGAGTVLRDYSGNGNDGTLGAAAAAPTWTAEGLSFDGDDQVIGASNTFGPTGAFSIVAVVTPAANDGGAILSKLNSFADTGSAGWELRKNTAATWRGVCYDGEGAKQNCYGTSVLGVPNYVTFIYDGTAIRIVTGPGTAGAAVAIAGFTPSTANPLAIGRLSSGASAFHTGVLHAAIVYPFALTDSQDAQNRAVLRQILIARGLAPAW